MGRAQGYQTSGDIDITAPAASTPGGITVLSALAIDTAPAADGTRQKQVFVKYAKDDEASAVDGVWVYFDYPDSAGAFTPANGTIGEDGTRPAGSGFNPASIGYRPISASGELSFSFRAPIGQSNRRRRQDIGPYPSPVQYARVYLVPGTSQRVGAPVQAGEAGESPSCQFPYLPPNELATGRENAPLVRDVELIPFDELGWSANPRQITTADGQQALQFAIRWTWPTDDQQFNVLAGSDIYLKSTSQEVFKARISKSSPATYISDEIVIPPGETAYTVYVKSFGVSGLANQQIDGVTPAVSFTFSRQLGPLGVEFTRMVESDGIHPFVVSAIANNSDGTSLRHITGYWKNLTIDDVGYDPTFAGVEMVAKKPDGSYVLLAKGTTSPIEAYVSDPSAVETWRVSLRSVDVNGRHNSIVDDGDEIVELGETPRTTLTVGSATPQLNLGMARHDSFSAQFTTTAGFLEIEALHAELLVAGRMQVGGPGMVSQTKFFDTFGSLIGFDGDDTGDSGYVGGWRKVFRMGGATPTSSADDQIRVEGGLVSIGANITVAVAGTASSVPAGGIIGQLSFAQIDNSTVEISGDQIDSIPIGKVTGTIYVNAPNVLGLLSFDQVDNSTVFITGDQIDSVPIGKVTGTIYVNAGNVLGLLSFDQVDNSTVFITGDQIDSLAFGKVTGTIYVNAPNVLGLLSFDQVDSSTVEIVSDQIASLAFGKVTGTVSVDAINIQGQLIADQIYTVNTTSFQGVIVSDQLANEIIDNLGKYSAATRPVPELSTLPTLPDDNFLEGTYFYYKSNGHFYQVDSGGGTYTDKGTDPDALVGALRLFHVGSMNVQNLTGLLLADQIDSVYVGSLIGALTAAMIVSVDATTITINQLVDSQIASVAAGKLIAGTVTATVTMTSPILQITNSTGGLSSDPVVINIDSTNFIHMNDTGGYLADLIPSSLILRSDPGGIRGPADQQMTLARNAIQFRDSGRRYAEMAIDVSGFGYLQLSNPVVGSPEYVYLGRASGHGFLRIDGTKVIGAQGAAISDPTSSHSTASFSDVNAALNALAAKILAHLNSDRTHGLIAT